MGGIYDVNKIPYLALPGTSLVEEALEQPEDYKSWTITVLGKLHTWYPLAKHRATR